MEVIKKICAVILIVTGVYFLASGAVDLAYAQDTEIIEARFNFSLKGLDGNNITLSQFRNKKSVILFFWTTWCPFCLQELRNLNQIYPTLILDDIEVLAINVQESESKVRRFLRRNPAVFKILLDTDGHVAYNYRLIGIPMFVLINKIGEIVFQDYYFPQKIYKKFLTEGSFAK